ncbi:ATP-binding protein [Arenibaculum pallidiluteum]|uniref:ATP-binding protein n=1 Tax=Arenibaculum pallidiluteum TaxID=2812559 RepID=UPI001A957B0B|nr:ATP-binding protein [Arenibaculum pallidiluteum]
MRDWNGEPPGDRLALLTTLPPGRGQLRLAGLVLLVLLAALLAAVPFARVPLPGTETLLQGYAVAVLTNEIITSVLLFGIYAVQRSPAVLALAVGYVFAALCIIPWLLTFPGVLAPNGLLGSKLQSTAWIAALRRLGFPAFVLAFALLGDRPPHGPRGSAKPVILTSLVATGAGVALFTWLVVAQESALPALMTASGPNALWLVVPAGAVLLCAIALVFLWRSRRTVLRLWLMVVVSAWMIETLLLGFISAGRLSLGWWAGRLYGLTAASLVLVVLLSEMTRLYAVLMRSVSAERHAREARLTTMEALAASVAHEVNQPLASMVTNANAGLRWLERASPDLGEARTALKRIVREGHRAGAVVEGIRSMFRRTGQDCGPVDVNDVLHDALDHATGELPPGRISVHLDLEDRIGPVVGNPVQLRQAVSNLITNAIDAMQTMEGRPRLLRVKSALRGGNEVLVSVEDSGPGLDPEYGQRVFEPFFTTKPDGMGMGLMIARSIVEGHGGTLWIGQSGPEGTIFCFTLPVAGGEAQPARRRT